MARASLLAPAVLAVAEPEALPSNGSEHEGRFTQAQAASAAGIGEDTLIRWISKGLIDPPKVKFSERSWWWTQEDVESIKAFKRTSLDDRRVATGRLTKKQAATAAGIGKATLHKWLRSGRVQAPEDGLWTEADIERIRAARRKPSKQSKGAI